MLFRCSQFLQILHGKVVESLIFLVVCYTDPSCYLAIWSLVMGISNIGLIFRSSFPYSFQNNFVLFDFTHLNQIPLLFKEVSSSSKSWPSLRMRSWNMLIFQMQKLFNGANEDALVSKATTTSFCIFLFQWARILS